MTSSAPAAAVVRSEGRDRRIAESSFVSTVCDQYPVQRASEVKRAL
jgi:hypothetical protein